RDHRRRHRGPRRPGRVGGQQVPRAVGAGSRVVAGVPAIAVKRSRRSTVNSRQPRAKARPETVDCRLWTVNLTFDHYAANSYKYRTNDFTAPSIPRSLGFDDSIK